MTFFSLKTQSALEPGQRRSAPSWRRSKWPIMAGALAMTCGAHVASGAEYYLPAEKDQWFVRAGARVLFNVKASVTMTPNPVTAGVYDDGYVLPDIGQGLSGSTWNWGYDQSGQISSGQVRFSRLTDVPLAGLMSAETATAMGGEVMVGSELADFEFRRKPVRMGWEMGYGYNSFSVKNTSRVSGTALLTVAAHNLGSLPAPAAPYAGSFDQPGPDVELTPAISGSQTSPVASFFDGELESSLHNLKMGLWMEYMLTGRMRANLSVGYSSIFADTKLRYTESITYTNPGFESSGELRREVGGRDWQPGIYVQVRVRYDLTKHWGAFVGGDVQYNKSLQFHGNGRDVDLDLGPAFGVTAGVVFQF